MDIESLMLITDSELIELFPIQYLGIRIKFRKYLSQWKQTVTTFIFSIII